ncbi:hypothetical protein OCS65_18290 [Rhodococcus aetherivorans]|uniref:Uncharacterized protein n=1 Tax=Rhodococcus aetherivorans TaxID=191292 RepID=A0AA46P269_9NOCA|nr:hypothetical protein [Rhodococcus aetherivorans]UYF92430.1 hypothetical protein OCS65_18290 [Rhodococcus aetherivorans]
MTDTSQLDAEYRTFVKQLHGDAVQTITDFTIFWDHFEAYVINGSDMGRTEESAQAEVDKYRSKHHPRLLRLAFGHPDPEVRYQAELLAQRMTPASISAIRAEESKSDSYRNAALNNGRESVGALRKAIYHAPFRDARPEPAYDGKRLAPVDPIPKD